MKTLGSSFKTRVKPLFRREATSLRQLLACKAMVWGNCAINRIRYKRLQAIAEERLQALTDKRAENVFVFANGPSLNDLDFAKIKVLVDQREFDLITVNSFASKGITKYNITPSVAVFGDPAHYIGSDRNGIFPQFEEDIRIVNQHKIPTLVPNRYFSHSQFNSGIPYCGAHNQYGKNVSNVLKPLGFYSVTAFVALSLAIHLGYKKIYICGFDNSYFREFEVDQENKRFIQDRHFYDTRKSARRVMDYERYGPTSDIFLDIARHFQYLEKISALKPGDVNIFNVAQVTYTDAFPRSFDLDIYTNMDTKVSGDILWDTISYLP